MVKRLLKIGGIILGVILLLFLFGFGRSFLGVHQIDRIELHTYSHAGLSGNKKAVLSTEEVHAVAALYNLSRHAGDITAEPCCDAYWLEIYLKDGTKIRISEGVRTKLIIDPVSSDRYYLDNFILVDYIKKLISDHDLVWD